MHHEILIVGGGIAGMESALTLGDMGYKVLLVEKEASIGGKMILLSKVFPTLDCSSCISTPKMASTAHHPNVTVLTSSEVGEIAPRSNGGFLARINKRATFVDPTKCTGCADCEFACTVAVSDAANFDLVAHRAAHIIYPQAVPKIARITRPGSSPCSATCPGGVKAHGYVSLVRAGKYEEAFNLHMEDAPLPGTLSRACYAPCEDECTRGKLEGPVSIRGIKRFMVDYYYERHPEPEYGPPEKLLDKKVAIVGSGPSGLTTAYHLARKGYRVKIFEASSDTGGVLRFGIPPYRLPRDILDRDIKNITALGVEIQVDSPIDSVRSLKDQGFDAIYVAVGATAPLYLGIPGEDLEGVISCMESLEQAICDEGCVLEGKTVLMFGGGNACMDPARMAIRRGAKKVIIQYRRTMKEMPAHHWEVEAALEEGVEIQFLKTPVRLLGIDGKLMGVESISMRLGEPDESGRRRPIPIKGSEEIIAADVAVRAIGLRPNTAPFGEELDLDPGETLKVSEETLETLIPGVFAGGDAVTGPSMIIEAVGQGKRAAYYIDRYLQGKPRAQAAFDQRLPMTDSDEVIARSKHISRLDPIPNPNLSPEVRIKSLDEIEGSVNEEQARYSANRCLDCGVCSECQECVSACPADAIDLNMRDEELIVDVGSVIVSTGFELFEPRVKSAYGYGRLPNVITAMQMDRVLSPTRPYNHVVRPSDGKAPDNVAYVLCVGSRDLTVNNPLCSRFCCMYTIKQAQLIMGALPLADITIYYIDIRAFGKGYDEFFEQAKAMGVYFVKGKVAKVDPADNGNLTVSYEDIAGEGGMKQAEHDLVVLSVGAMPNPDALTLFRKGLLEGSEYSFVKEVDEDLNPGQTSIEGVFVAGAASEPRDIPDSIVHAGAAAAQVAAYIERNKESVRA